MTNQTDRRLISQDFEKLLHEIGLDDHAEFINSPKTIDVEEEIKVEKRNQ